jgi:hypothetical protein
MPPQQPHQNHFRWFAIVLSAGMVHVSRQYFGATGPAAAALKELSMLLRHSATIGRVSAMLGAAWLDFAHDLALAVVLVDLLIAHEKVTQGWRLLLF